MGTIGAIPPVEKHMEKINTLATLRQFFAPGMPAREWLEEAKKLTQQDREELLAGIVKVGGEIVYVK